MRYIIFDLFILKICFSFSSIQSINNNNSMNNQNIPKYMNIYKLNNNLFTNSEKSSKYKTELNNTNDIYFNKFLKDSSKTNLKVSQMKKNIISYEKVIFKENRPQNETIKQIDKYIFESEIILTINLIGKYTEDISNFSNNDKINYLKIITDQRDNKNLNNDYSIKIVENFNMEKSKISHFKNVHLIIEENKPRTIYDLTAENKFNNQSDKNIIWYLFRVENILKGIYNKKIISFVLPQLNNMMNKCISKKKTVEKPTNNSIQNALDENNKNLNPNYNSIIEYCLEVLEKNGSKVQKLILFLRPLKRLNEEILSNYKVSILRNYINGGSMVLRRNKFPIYSAVPLNWSQNRSILIKSRSCKKCLILPKVNIITPRHLRKVQLFVNSTYALRCRIKPGRPSKTEVIWTKNNTPLKREMVDSHMKIQNKEKISILRIKNAREDDSGDYSCAARSYIGTAISHKVKISVKLWPPLSSSDFTRCDPNYCRNEGLCYYHAKHRKQKMCFCQSGYEGDRCHNRDHSSVPNHGFLLENRRTQPKSEFDANEVLLVMCLIVSSLSLLGTLLSACWLRYKFSKQVHIDTNNDKINNYNEKINHSINNKHDNKSNNINSKYNECNGIQTKHVYNSYVNDINNSSVKNPYKTSTLLNEVSSSISNNRYIKPRQRHLSMNSSYRSLETCSNSIRDDNKTHNEILSKLDNQISGHRNNKQYNNNDSSRQTFLLINSPSSINKKFQHFKLIDDNDEISEIIQSP